jgi:hypothetical protein
MVADMSADIPFDVLVLSDSGRPAVSAGRIMLGGGIGFAVHIALRDGWERIAR